MDGKTQDHCLLNNDDFDIITNNEMLDDKIIDVARKLAMQNNPLLNIQSCNTIRELSEYNN